MQNISRIYSLSKRNIILRYKNSVIGFFWGFFKPLLYLLIIIVVFKSQSNIDNYVLYATSGLIFWIFFANVTNQSIASIINSSGIIKALNVPTVFFPLSEMISELFNFILTLFVFAIAMHWFGIQYSFNLLTIIPITILFAVFTFGITLIFCSLNVFFRDVGILWTTIQPAIFYLTPIPYPEKVLTDRYPLVVQLNPIYYFIKLEREVIYKGVFPSGELWLQCTVLATGMLCIGYFIFSRLKNQFISSL